MKPTLRLRSVSGESALGLVARLAARHGQRDVCRFAKSIGVRFNDLFDPSVLRRLVVVSGMPEDLDVEANRDASGRKVQIGRAIFARDQLSRAPRFCSVCLEEDRRRARLAGVPGDWLCAHRIFWSISSVTVCVVHHVRLENRCASCGAVADFRIAPLFECRCGSMAGARISADADELALAHYIERSLSADQSEDHQFLRMLDLRDQLRLFAKLGKIDLFGWCARQPNDAHTVAQGFKVAASWPDGVLQALDRVMAQAPNGARGLLASYGWIYGSWLSSEDSPSSRLLLPVLIEHAVKNGIIARGERDVGYATSLTAIARANRVSFARLRMALAEEGAIPRGSRQGVAYAIEGQGKARLEQKINAGISWATASHLLGIGRSRVRDLLANGLISRTGRQIDGRTVARLGQQLERRVGREPAPASARTFAEVCRHEARPMTALIKEIRSGRRPAWFLDDEAKGLLGRLMLVPSRRDTCEQLVSVQAAAKVLQVHHECVRKLARAGHLRRRNGRGLDARSVQRFHRRYVSIAAFAAARSMSPSAVIELLAASGKSICFETRHFRQAIIDRGSLKSLED